MEISFGEMGEKSALSHFHMRNIIIKMLRKVKSNYPKNE